MFSRLKRFAPATMAAVLAFAGSAPASAAITVTVLGVDDLTGGNYPNGPVAGVPFAADTYGLYGSCFSVISQASPRRQRPEVEVGPGFYGDDPTAYDNRCSASMITSGDPRNISGCNASGVVEGDLIPNREPGLDSAVCITEEEVVTTNPQNFDFRFYRRDTTSPNQQANAFAWSFLENDGDGALETYEVVPFPNAWFPSMASGPSQYNACLTPLDGPEVFRASTFDNEEFGFDPLSGVLDIKADGNATLAYYFLTAGLACRNQLWELFIDEGAGEQLKASGSIGDFAGGKYLVFNLDGIPAGGALVRLATRDNNGVNGCSVANSKKAANSHISGIFVAGTSVCSGGDLFCDDTSISKLTNGQDGPSVNAGDLIQWSYHVRNDNEVEVAYTVEDSVEGPVCSGTLAPGGETTCYKEGVAGLEDYLNIGTVTFSRENWTSASCTDTSSYIVNPPPPDLICLDGTSINKLTNDADGLSLEPGTDIVWSYDVLNQNQEQVSYTVTDDQEGVICSGTLAAGQSTTCTRAGTSGDVDYANVGTLTLTTVDGRIAACSDGSSYTVAETPPTNPGTGTPGYWKTHPEAWPAATITIGGKVYTVAEAIALMKSPTKQDKTFNLFEQLVAAKLNVAIGNDDSCIADTIAAADAWMTVHPVGSGVRANSAAWQSETDPSASELLSTLDAYNNGLLCAPHRD